MFMEHQYEENMIYAELWKRDAAIKDKKEEEDEVIIRKMKVDGRNSIYIGKRLIVIKSKMKKKKYLKKEQWKLEEERIMEIRRRNDNGNY